MPTSFLEIYLTDTTGVNDFRVYCSQYGKGRDLKGSQLAVKAINCAPECFSAGDHSVPVVGQLQICHITKETDHSLDKETVSRHKELWCGWNRKDRANRFLSYGYSQFPSIAFHFRDYWGVAICPGSNAFLCRDILHAVWKELHELLVACDKLIPRQQREMAKNKECDFEVCPSLYLDSNVDASIDVSTDKAPIMSVVDAVVSGKVIQLEQ